LKEENVRLMTRLEVDKQFKGKGVKDTVHVGLRTLSKGMAAHETKEDSKYNPTPRNKGPTNKSTNDHKKSNFITIH